MSQKRQTHKRATRNAAIAHCMSANACGILVLVSIAAAQAFQAPPPPSVRRHDGLERARQQAPRAGTVALARVRSPPQVAALHPPQALSMGSFALTYPVTAEAKRLPSKSDAMTRSTLLGAAVCVVLMKACQLRCSPFRCFISIDV